MVPMTANSNALFRHDVGMVAPRALRAAPSNGANGLLLLVSLSVGQSVIANCGGTGMVRPTLLALGVDPLYRSLRA